MENQSKGIISPARCDRFTRLNRPRYITRQTRSLCQTQASVLDAFFDMLLEKTTTLMDRDKVTIQRRDLKRALQKDDTIRYILVRIFQNEPIIQGNEEVLHLPTHILIDDARRETQSKRGKKEEGEEEEADLAHGNEGEEEDDDNVLARADPEVMAESDDDIEESDESGEE